LGLVKPETVRPFDQRCRWESWGTWPLLLDRSRLSWSVVRRRGAVDAGRLGNGKRWFRALVEFRPKRKPGNV